MRPMKLIMQAFGAYPDYVEIPFSNLKEGSIYLISGATGSGKTTIFDAISFSLFNTSCGFRRGNDTLRSHFAKDSVESYVEFEFLFNGDIYKVYRTPSYLRNKLRGKGQILQAAKAMLTLPNGKTVIGVSEVNGFIEELLGLNAQRFSQIALLAQGEFLKLLNSDTQTRGEIFREIFKTSSYSYFQQNLCDITKEKRVLLDKSNEFIYHNLSDIECNCVEINETKEKICQNRTYETLNDFIEQLELQNKNDEFEIGEFEKQSTDLSEEIVELEKYIDKVKLKINLTDKLNQTDENIKRKQIEFEQCKKEFLTLDNKKLELDNLKLKQKKTNEDYNKAVEIEKIIKEYDKNALIKDELQKEAENNFELLNKLKYNYLCHLKYESDKTEENLTNLHNRLKELQDNFNVKNKNYIDLRNNYLNHQAGILAASLNDGVPCPVCGSLVHPNPAKINGDIISKEELDILNNELEKLNNELSECALLANSEKEKLKNQKENFSLLIKKFNPDCEVIPKKEKIDYEVKNLELENKEKELREKIEKNNIELTRISTNLEVLKKDLVEFDIEKITNEHKRLISEVENLTKKIQEIEKKYEESNINLSALTSQKNLLNRQIDELKDYNTDLSEKIKKLALNKEKLISLTANIQKYVSRKTINEKKILLIKDEYNKYKKFESEYLTCKNLSDCAQGQLKGKAKIAFEQYIQGYYLDIVLFEANKRLKTMSKGQFQLQRKKDVSQKAYKTGLDIEVMDFHTFKVRDTKTLSGGESFMAALSLALGLSDCISNLSGAINIEALFIDEGFGTLDSDSLELALDVILSLSATNRLVGIISHVDELKNRIQNKILTFKTNYGSRCDINF